MRNSALEILRSRTSRLHRETERALDLKRAASSLPEYQRLIARLLGFYEPLEEQLFSRPDSTVSRSIDLEARRKTPALRADLALLNPDRKVGVSACTYVPTFATDAALAGAWYVVEGATLGGKIIADYLSRQLGLGPRTGAAFFDCYGEQRQGRWDEYCDFLSSISDRDVDEVANGAVELFDSMRRWLDGRSVGEVHTTRFLKPMNAAG
ncbi:MAG: biliverdin-producing heme oxygenase [Steroidobacteraceae bacterium]